MSCEYVKIDIREGHLEDQIKDLGVPMDDRLGKGLMSTLTLSNLSGMLCFTCTQIVISWLTRPPSRTSITHNRL